MDETQDTGLTVTEQPPAARLRTLSNGAVYDEDKGRIVANPGGGKYAFTTETSYKAKEALRQQAINAYWRGMKQGVGADTRASVISKVAEAQAKIASDADKGRAATYAMEKSFQFLGLWPEKQSEAPAPGGITVHIGAQVAEMLAEMVFERANG